MENLFHAVEGVGDRLGAHVLGKQAHVQHEDLDERGEAELAGLQDHVHLVHGVEQRFLRPVHAKRDLVSARVLDLVQVVEAPAPVA